MVTKIPAQSSLHALIRRSGYKDALEEVLSPPSIFNVNENEPLEEIASSSHVTGGNLTISALSLPSTFHTSDQSEDAESTTTLHDPEQPGATHSTSTLEPISSHYSDALEMIDAEEDDNDHESPQTEAEFTESEADVYHETAAEVVSIQNTPSLSLNRSRPALGDNVPLHVLRRVSWRDANAGPDPILAKELDTGASSSRALSRPISILSSLDDDAGQYKSPTRQDTEARLGPPLSVSAAEALFNAVQDNPKSLLARCATKNPFELPEIQQLIYFYAAAFMVLQILTAIATHLLLGIGTFVVLVLIQGFMTVRYYMGIWKRVQAVKELGLQLQARRKLIARRASQAAVTSTRQSPPTTG
jgi:hypothetical protein